MSKMSLDKIARKNSCQNSSQIHQIHVKTASEKNKTKFFFLIWPEGLSWMRGPAGFARPSRMPLGPAGRWCAASPPAPRPQPGPGPGFQPEARARLGQNRPISRGAWPNSGLSRWRPRVQGTARSRPFIPIGRSSTSIAGSKPRSRPVAPKP
jgi:hypothetical protein